MRKRYYIIFVAREEDGRLRKIPIPLHYAYIFVAAALIGAFTITGMAGSYTRMLVKTASFDQVRSQRESLRKDYARLEQVTHQKDVQAASLGSLASQVAALYLHPSHTGKSSNAAAGGTLVATPAAGENAENADAFTEKDYARTLDEFTALRASALAGRLNSSGALLRSPGFDGGLNMAAAPSIWPVMGRVTSSFGEREDPFNGEGAFHAGIDIATAYGTPIYAPADGLVEKAGAANGYGREMILDHGQGLTTVYGHLSGFAVVAGQQVRRGQVIGYVGSAGRSTGPHLHYEVRIHDTPVNPHKYLRETMDQQVASSGSSAGSGSIF